MSRSSCGDLKEIGGADAKKLGRALEALTPRTTNE
jgi:hypothetical protein